MLRDERETKMELDMAVHTTSMCGVLHVHICVKGHLDVITIKLYRIPKLIPELNYNSVDIPKQCSQKIDISSL